MSKDTPTKSLHPRTRALKALMSKYSLSTADVATLLSKSPQTGKRYSGGFTIISEALLDLLKYKLNEK